MHIISVINPFSVYEHNYVGEIRPVCCLAETESETSHIVPAFLAGLVA